jgi:hypothetical protein
MRSVLAQHQYYLDEIAYFQSVQAIPGIGQFAADQFDEYTTAGQIGADFTALINALIAVRDQVIADMPTGGAGGDWLLEREIDGVTGVLSDRMLTPAQTAALRTALAAVVATVD